MIQIWDSNQQVFRDPQFIRRYDAQAGAWVDCQEGKVFKDGSWETVWPAKPKKFMLYDTGKEYEAGFTTWYNLNLSSSAVEKAADKIILRSNNALGAQCGVCTNQLVDLAPYDKMCAVVQINSPVNDAYDSLDVSAISKKLSGSTSTTGPWIGESYAGASTREKGKIITLEADISGLTVSAYIIIYQYYVASAYIYQIWLE